jgi:hypothetical protein
MNEGLRNYYTQLHERRGGSPFTGFYLYPVFAIPQIPVSDSGPSELQSPELVRGMMGLARFVHDVRSTGPSSCFSMSTTNDDRGNKEIRDI